MPVQKNILFSGTAGGIIFYEMNGKQYIRSKPVKNKQTKATKQSSANFGQAQTAAAHIRMAFSSIITDRKLFDNKLRLANPVQQWIIQNGMHSKTKENDLPFITGFEFNSQTSVLQRWMVPLTVSRQPKEGLLLDIPAYNPVKNIEAPSHTQAVEICIAVAVYSITKKQLISQYKTSIKIDYTSSNQPAQQIPLPAKTTAGNLTVVLIAMRYYTLKKGHEEPIMQQRWLPASIITALYN